MSSQEPLHRLPAGIHSLLDTDLYKLTMQAALLQHFPNIGQLQTVNPTNSVEVSYIFINRTKSMKLTYEAYTWLGPQINGSQWVTLAISLTAEQHLKIYVLQMRK